MSKSNRRVTLKEIAEVTGLHRTSVSRALRDHPGIPEETRIRVKKEAERLGYTQDPVLSALSAYTRSYSQPKYQTTIGLLSNWDIQNSTNQHHTFRSFIEGIQTRAKTLGFKTEHFSTLSFQKSPGRLSKILQARNITPIIVLPLKINHPSPILEWEQFMTVLVGFSFPKHELDRVTHHHRSAIKLALTHARQAGYRSFGLITNAHIDQRTEHGYLSGFLEAKYLAPRKERFNLWISKSKRPDFSTLKNWIAKNKPDVIFSANQDFIDVINSVDLKIPEDVAFVQLDLPPNHNHVAGIRQNSEHVGKAAVDQVNSLYQANEKGLPNTAKTIQIEGDWVNGDTLPPKC
ncbi:MAG: LacI family DNA-binding transcriptional regulator [Verrucomicrobiota bacterium]